MNAICAADFVFVLDTSKCLLVCPPLLSYIYVQVKLILIDSRETCKSNFKNWLHRKYNQKHIQKKDCGYTSSIIHVFWEFFVWNLKWWVIYRKCWSSGMTGNRSLTLTSQVCYISAEKDPPFLVLSPPLTDIHHAIIHAVNSHHFHEVVLVVSPLWALWEVSVVLKKIAEELQIETRRSVWSH